MKLIFLFAYFTQIFADLVRKVKVKSKKVKGFASLSLFFFYHRFSQIIAKGKGQKVKGKRVRVVKFIFHYHRLHRFTQIPYF